MVGDREVLERFESHVDRTGEHHLWLGSRNPQRGTGKLQVDGKQVTAHRYAWELAHGRLAANEVVNPCPDEPLCVRVDHLSVSRRRAQPRSGSTRIQIQVNGNRADRRVRGTREDIDFVKGLLREQLHRAAPQDQDATRWTNEDLITHYLAYLEEQGREARTIRRYKSAAKNWVLPAVGSKSARRTTPDDIDRCFARMRRAGQSSGSMNYAKAVLSGAYRWGRRTGKVMHNPLLDLQMPKSTYVPSERLPPEADDIALNLAAAFEHTPVIAPILVLASITGARLGELIAPRKSDIDWGRSLLRVWAAMDIDGSLKDPKRAWHRREVPLDDETLKMLRGLLAEMDDRCTSVGAHTASDPFLFSLEPDGSKPLLPDYATKQLQVLKGYLGVENKKPETIALENEALRLRRCGLIDRTGRPRPVPRDGAACPISTSPAHSTAQSRGRNTPVPPRSGGSRQRVSTSTSISHSMAFASSRRANCSMPGSISASYLTVREPRPRFWRSTTQSRVCRHAVKQRIISATLFMVLLSGRELERG